MSGWRDLPGVRGLRGALWGAHESPVVLQRLLAVERDRLALEAERFVRELLTAPRYADPRALARFEHQVFSQAGEDGILAEVLRRVGAPTRTFVEIGVGDGRENNTTWLLMQGWRGGWIDGDEASARAIGAHFATPLADGRLVLRRALVTAENAAAEVAALGLGQEPDVLSLDVDRNTYHVWRGLSALRPRVVVVEYNAQLPAEADWVAEYDAAKGWDGSAYFGASLAALERLGRAQGYRLVGCCLAGTNAFFVREALAGDLFAGPFTAQALYEPPRHFLTRTRVSHRAAFTD